MRRVLLREILVGIVVWVLISLCIQPLANNFAPFALSTGVHLYTGIIDNLYRNAANAPPASLTLFIITMIVGAGAGFSVSALMALFSSITRVRKMREALEKLSLIGQERSAEQEKIAEQERSAEAQKVEPMSLRSVYWLAGALTFLLVSLVVTSGIVAAAFNLQVGIQDTLSRRLRLLAPHVTEQQRLTLDAEWASIQSRSDYVSLNHHLEDLAASAGITLPPARVK